VEPDGRGVQLAEGVGTLGRQIVDALGPGASRELLDVITCPEAERAALIGRLHVREDAVGGKGLRFAVRS
jgi:hypothetical protein